MGPPGHLIAQTDGSGIDTGSDDKLRFQVISRSRVDQVDARIDVAIGHRAEGGDVRPPGWFRADQEIGLAGKRIDPFDDRARIGAWETQVQRALAPRNANACVFKKCREPWAFHHVAHIAIHLAAVLDKEQRHMAVIGLGLLHEVYGHSDPGYCGPEAETSKLGY